MGLSFEFTAIDCSLVIGSAQNTFQALTATN